MRGLSMPLRSPGARSWPPTTYPERQAEVLARSKRRHELVRLRAEIRALNPAAFDAVGEAYGLRDLRRMRVFTAAGRSAQAVATELAAAAFTPPPPPESAPAQGTSPPRPISV